MQQNFIVFLILLHTLTTCRIVLSLVDYINTTPRVAK